VKETFPISAFKESVKFRLFPVATISRDSRESAASSPPPVHCPLIRPYFPDAISFILRLGPPESPDTDCLSRTALLDRADLFLALKPSARTSSRFTVVPGNPASQAILDQTQHRPLLFPPAPRDFFPARGARSAAVSFNFNRDGRKRRMAACDLEEAYIFESTTPSGDPRRHASTPESLGTSLRCHRREIPSPPRADATLDAP